MNRAEVTEMVRRRTSAGDGMFVSLVVEHDGTVVGDLLLHLQGTGLSEGEIGWTLLPQHVGRGYATEAAQNCAHLAIQVHGGSGYVDDHPVERYYRDVRVTTLYEGTSQIQKLIIGRAETGLNALIPS